ncbi:MAG: radical SAM protein [Candidatus Aminicenantes bacterium]|nr:radical SAM protein [Candidatus Aminicenantes bacterium]
MSTNRKHLYRFPWSMTDNPGGWVDVTDSCNLNCSHCFRHKLEGHRPLKDVLSDITACLAIRNCDDMKISGGEPLTYPHLLEVVRFIAKKGIKPFLMTNGVGLDRSLVSALAQAGLSRFNFHIDSTQDRPGWEGRNEDQLNELRQSYAEMVASVKGIGCGFNVTVSRSNLEYIPDVVGWATRNIKIVHHMTLIALRGIVVADNVALFAKGKRLSADAIPSRIENPDEIALTSDGILIKLQERFPSISPSGFLNGTAFPETNKYLVSVVIGSRRHIYGSFGARTLEITQTATHLAKGRYVSITRRTKVGRKIFLFAALDPSIRKAFARFIKILIVRPWHAFERIYIQPIAIEQPLELIEGEPNICDDCINMMIYRGRLIPSCRIEEYRLFGGPLISQKIV